MRHLPLHRLAAAAATVAVWFGNVAAQEVSPPPLDLGRTERVEVRYVLLDVVVLDRRGRTVPGLRAEDFDLLVDHRLVELATADEDCPLGRSEDPSAGEASSFAGTTPPPGPPRHFVHLFDYLHLELAAETLGDAGEGLSRLAVDGEAQMILSLGETLRVESPFTSDLAEVERTLRRMRADATLYAGSYGRLTERRFFDGILTVIDLLGTTPGSKVVLLYSGPFAGNGFTYDPYFERIAARAAEARVSFYPVDAGGLRPPRGFAYGDLGGPKKLARLAVETGGRVTYNTNDVGLAYARAQRDRGCRYTLGFYDRAPRLDRSRRVAVYVRRRGIRVVHPSFYVVRSDGERRQSQARTALVVPRFFPAAGVTAAVVPVVPLTRRWSVELQVRVPADLLREPGPEGWQIDAEIRRPTGSRVRRIERAVGWAEEGWIRESLRLRPGSYRGSVVLSHPDRPEPLAVPLEFLLPRIPPPDASSTESSPEPTGGAPRGG